MADWNVSDGIVVIAETTEKALAEANVSAEEFLNENSELKTVFHRVFTSLDYNSRILGMFRPDVSEVETNGSLPKIKIFSILIKIKEEHQRTFLSVSGRGGMFFRLKKDNPLNRVISVIWLGKTDLKSAVEINNKVSNAYGVALCRGNYGVRVESASREEVRKSIGVKSLGYFSVEGIPKGLPAENIAINFATKGIAAKAIKIIDGKWIVKIEDDFLGAEDRMVLEWPESGVTLRCNRTERPKPRSITHTAKSEPQVKSGETKQQENKQENSGIESKLDKLLSMNETYFNKIDNIEKNVELSNKRIANVEINATKQNRNFEVIEKRFKEIETKLEILLPGLGQTEITGTTGDTDMDMSNGEYE